MNDPFQTMLQQAGLKSTVFSATSRYYGIETATIKRGPGEEPVVFLRRRFVPSPERFATLQEHVLEQGERPDLIANQYLADPERFWQICDANNVIRPEELTEVIGRYIRITLPEGIPGYNNA
jgi:hypothetical protein